ncbi:uncharacterized protein LOC116849732 [Odontomachus brunneus]|uniref:uncharacterized protein LOC116849732 n=1 Tax=Odontomachus brunneus TaxID=486640 RepID=UPI0013F1E3F4|nr:uncharacterized protein LOC116849732 [Odontomachus brunneus]
MASKLLQANLGHTRIAQDLFLHSLAERRAGLGVAAEPYRIPADDSRWFGVSGSSVAIYWRWNRADYETHLDRVSGVVRRCAPHPLVVAGDFNAKSRAWGSPATNVRGRLTEFWTASTGLCLLNEGSMSTCVRPQGESIIDLTWVNGPAARAVGVWKLAEVTDTGSDHLYIEVVLSAVPPEVLRRRRDRERGRSSRWDLRKMDAGALRASIVATEWSPGGGFSSLLREQAEVKEEAEELRHGQGV